MQDKRKLVIVGAGAFARELLGWIAMLQAPHFQFDVLGFLDRNPEALRSFPCDLKVLGSDKLYPIKEDEVFACGLTHPRIKLAACRELEARGAKFVSIIHPTALIGPYCQIEDGSVICPNAVLTNNIKIGKFVTVNLGVGIGHDTVLEDGVTINPGVQIAGKTRLSEGVFVGSNASILEKLNVGSYARIGAGSVVVSRVPENWTMMGVPARRLKLYKNETD